jgi:hypothetical protein
MTAEPSAINKMVKMKDQLFEVPQNRAPIRMAYGYLLP